MQRAAIFRRERQIGEVKVFCGFVVCLRKSERSARDIGDFLLCGLIEYACVLFSRRSRRGRRENTASPTQIYSTTLEIFAYLRTFVK